MDNLVISGGLQDQQTGYSAILHFETASAQDKPESVTVAEIGLMAGAADPMMQFPAGTTFTPYTVLRNVADTPLTLTPTLWWMESGAAHSAQLPPVTLQAYETGGLDVASLLAQFGPKNFNGSFNLVFNGAVRQGSLVMVSGSVDQSNTYVFEVVPRGVTEGMAKSIQYWSTGNGDDTMVSLWNPADEAQDFVFTLYFKGGHYALPLHLEPRVTRTFDISQIIQNQVPDADGNIIPASVHEGSAKIAGSQAENEHILVAIDVGVYNVRKATCTNQCQWCDGYTAFAMIDGLFGVAVNGNHQEAVQGTTNTGGQFNLAASWSSDHTNIATVSNGLVHGVSPGSATITGFASNVPLEEGYICTGPQGCPLVNISEGGGANVFQVTSVAPSPLVVGSGGRMVIRGSGFSLQQGTLSVNVDGAGVSVTNPSLGDDRDHEIIATYNVLANAPVGSRNLTVVFTQGETQVSSPPFPVAVTAASQGTVTGITPAQGLIGTTVSNVTINGSGFGSTPTVFAGTGITVTYVSRSNTQIKANFAIASTAPAGNHSVVVTTTAGAQLSPVNFFVQVPTSFARITVPGAPGGLGPVISITNGSVVDLAGNIVNGPNGPLTHQCGVYENFAFEIVDQQSTSITNGTVTVTEVFSNITNPPGPTPAVVTLDLSHQVVEDTQYIGHPAPTCLANNENQALDMTWTVRVGSGTLYPMSTLVHITKGNFNGNLNVTSSITIP